MVTAKEPQEQKAVSEHITESGMVTLCKEVQPSKAYGAMWVTESGMVRFIKELQFLKVLSPIKSNVVEMVTSDKELQSAKACFPTWVTELGIG